MKIPPPVALAGAAAALVTLAPAVAIANEASPRPTTKVISSCTHATYEPSNYILTCADGGARISRAHYTSWTDHSATGKGTYVYNTCTPSCAGGSFKHHPIEFVLERPRTVHGKRLFTRMLITYAGLAETFELPTSKL